MKLENIHLRFETAINVLRTSQLRFQTAINVLRSSQILRNVFKKREKKTHRTILRNVFKKRFLKNSPNWLSEMRNWMNVFLNKRNDKLRYTGVLMFVTNECFTL